MKKILCLVDFLEASKNGIEYAARLSKELSAHLTLLYVRTSILPHDLQSEQEERKSSEEISSWFYKIVDLIKKEFGVSCDYRIEPTINTLEETVSGFTSHFDLVVMGTSGVDSSFNYFFGTNSYSVIESSKCPVVVVPLGFLYRPIKQIVYAYDPETNPIFLIEQLRRFASSIGAGVKVLHISTKDKSEETNLRMEILEKAVMVREPKGIDWSFDFQYSDDVVWALNHYLKSNEADMCAVSFHQHTFLEKLNGKDVVKELSAATDVPIFVLWH
jgi:nucleotide-binding universal stress UspA family protein